MRRVETLKSLIKNTGMSLKAFSRKVGIPYTTLLSILERGVGKASFDNVVAICKALNISVEYLNSTS